MNSEMNSEINNETSIVLKLKNFKSWIAKTIVIKKGITLFSGKSGIGKTSIFDALLFVLFGSGKNCAHNNANSYSVEFIDKQNNVIIKRTTQKSVKLDYKMKTYEDDIAQGIIFSIYSKSKLVMYLKQGGIKSFVNLGHAEKFKYLEKLSMDNVNIEDIQKRTADLAKERHDKIKNKDDSIQNLNNTIEVIKEVKFMNETDSSKIRKLFELNRGRYEKNKKDVKKLHIQYHIVQEQNEKINILSNSMNISSTNIQNITLKMNAINTDLPIEEWKTKYNTLEQMQKDFIINKEKIQKRVILQSKITTQKNNLQSVRDQIKHTKEQIGKYKTVEFYESAIQKNNNLKYKLKEYKNYTQEQIKIKNNLTRFSVTLKEIDELQSKQDKLNTKIQKKIQLQKLEQKKLKCPECNINLCLKNGSLTVCNTDFRESKLDLSKLQTQYRDISNQLRNKKRLYENKKSLENQLSDVTKKIEKMNIDTTLTQTPGDIDNIIMKNTKSLKELHRLKNTLSMHKQTKSNLKKSIQQNENTLQSFTIKSYDKYDEQKTNFEMKELQQRIQNYNHQYTLKTEYKKQYNKLLDDMNQYKKDIQFAKEKIEQIFPDAKDYIKLKEKLLSIIKEKNNSITHYQDVIIPEYNEWILYDTRITKQRKTEQQIGKLKDERYLLQKEYEGTLYFKKMIKYTESTVLMNFIYKLNINIKPYLEALFPEDEMNIVVSSFNDKKNKGKKPQIILNINYKNMNNVGFNNLSGGEKQRVSLAFTLAFAKIFNSPFLLLDECTSNLDEQMTTTAIETIKKHCQIPYIVVIEHQVISGIFDHVENFE